MKAKNLQVGDHLEDEYGISEIVEITQSGKYLLITFANTEAELFLPNLNLKYLSVYRDGDKID